MITRLRGRSTFQRLQRQGTRVRSSRLWCMMLPDPTTTDTHVGYAIGRTVGSAVTRNRLRRRLRAEMARRSNRLPAGFCLLGVAPKAAAQAGSWTSAQLGQELDDLLARVEALVPPTTSGHPDQGGKPS